MKLRNELQRQVRLDVDLISLRQIYEVLSDSKQKLLEQVLKKMVVCNHLLGELVPAAKCNSYWLDFDNYRDEATELARRDSKWDSLVDLYAMPSLQLPIAHSYLAVKCWNNQDFYTPEETGDYQCNNNYPLTTHDQYVLTEPERIERFVTVLNEPLDINVVISLG